MANVLASATFVLAANALAQLPKDSTAEVAFAGRSNAGKSTALNALCHQNGLARTSKTPGRTQQLVYFQISEGRYLVDLPGYGYAKVPEAIRAHWKAFINRYFESREPLAGMIIVMDVRHPLREYDLQKILTAAVDRKNQDKYAYLASVAEIAENDYNLNIPRYVDTFEEETEIDLMAVRAEREKLKAELAVLEERMAGYLKELGYE